MRRGEDIAQASHRTNRPKKPRGDETPLSKKTASSNCVARLQPFVALCTLVKSALPFLAGQVTVSPEATKPLDVNCKAGKAESHDTVPTPTRRSTQNRIACMLFSSNPVKTLHKDLNYTVRV